MVNGERNNGANFIAFLDLIQSLGWRSVLVLVGLGAFAVLGLVSASFSVVLSTIFFFIVYVIVNIIPFVVIAGAVYFVRQNLETLSDVLEIVTESYEKIQTLDKQILRALRS